MSRVILLSFVGSLLLASASGFAPSSLPSTPRLRGHATSSVTMMAANAKDGLFSPFVKGAKAALGEKELNALRGKVIAEHSKVISAFVETSESKFGKIALKKLFEAADTDGNGVLDKEEIRAAIKALGFSHLKDEQIEGIISRADVDENAVVDFEEFVRDAPLTLRTNLIKKAKVNGNDLGFLS
mmetsp:Transcript_4789/g.9495  ORF Transcript_4789/g.9495 Transcript_4789/m.9495 type:complete len:184 (+) Transcript_4789:63-614(+)|eukprot:CAMPEP_0173385652 /NCGR_PEP_ID=MMETSP1356-20130122/8263_1 /TAXON_ID=77927 ORGANISM="Hemiselmis virescens, Strain PCC157" /NCGR_SAMPLE_ID=MMETSP1356 /ASSEMBLY_ACC=CAM_ASM_000847 /LENGTH=183 /DNA_ID=CAMNT_0014341553 /DNA_START=63 /DNA_END=614 /DNA_ORIENTATION=-